MSTTKKTGTTTEGKPYSPLWRLISVIVLAPLVGVLIKNKYEGRENIPAKGGVILAPNHLSYVDWGTDALFFHRSGRYPTYMIKSGAFKVPFIGWFLLKAGQLPVYRGAADAALVLKEAEKRIGQGAAVIVYPEGTATRDPDLWPMVAKTGVARLALSSGAPVIPVAHWGTDEILHYGDKKPQFFPRKTVRTIAGPPVDLSEWAGQAHSAKALRAATDKIMTEVAALLGQLRGETPPEIPYDPKNPLSRTDNAVSPAPSDPEREPKAAATSGPTSEERSDKRGGNSSRPERPEASAGSKAGAGSKTSAENEPSTGSTE